MFDSDYVEAKAGESPTLTFTSPPLPEPVRHSLKKDGKVATKRFNIENSVITFRNVKEWDSGTYTISCESEDKSVIEEKLELWIAPASAPNEAQPTESDPKGTNN